MTPFPRLPNYRGRFNVLLLVIVLSVLVGTCLGLYGLAWLLIWLFRMFY